MKVGGETSTATDTTGTTRADDPKKLQDKRMRGAFKLFNIGGVLGKKKPPFATVDGRVDNGKCLLGKPLKEDQGDEAEEGPNQLSDEFIREVSEELIREGVPVPRFFAMEPTVDNTVVSGITLDRCLCRTKLEEVDPNDVKKTQSIGDEKSPASPPPLVDDSKQPPYSFTDDEISSFKRMISQTDAVVETAPSSTSQSPKNSSKRPKQLEIFFDSSQLGDTQKKEQKLESFHSRQQDIIVMPESLPTSSPQSEYLESPISPKRHADHLGYAAVTNILTEARAQRIPVACVYDESHLSSLLASASAGQAPPLLSTLQSIVDQLWAGGQRAKLQFHECHGYKMLAQMLWSLTANEPLEEKAVELFFATVVFEEENEKDTDNIETTAMLATEEARNAMEALLFVMQSLSHNENLQVTACRALVCLATASGLTDGQVDDGSSSGAAAVVLSSMSVHRNSARVLKWCTKALYELCTVSSNAESNKRTVLAASSLDRGGNAGSTVLLDCLQNSVGEAVRLVWCLSCCENARGSLDPAGLVLQATIQMLRQNVKSSSSALVEALLGAINNLYVIADDSTLPSEDPNELVSLALQAIQENRDCTGLCTEAIGLIANIAATTPMDKNSVVDAGGIALIAQLIMTHDDTAALHEESACALLSLSMGCDQVKAMIRSPPIFAAVKRLSRLYESSVRVQEILCTLLASVVVTTDAQAEPYEKDAIGLLCFAMTLHNTSECERVQEACCSALRNLSSRETTSVQEYLISSDAVDLVVDAISLHMESKVIVMNGCEMLWNVGFCSRDYPRQSETITGSLLEALRPNLDDVELLVSSFGVFLRILVGSNVIKELFYNKNGIDMVTSVLVMHRETESLLIPSCGILASLSFVPELVPVVVKGGGIACLVDTICLSNLPSPEFLTSALQFLTNVILVMPDECDQVARVVPVLIQRMEQCPSAMEFQSEACRFLWAMASLSEAVRSRILELGGVPVLLAILQNSRETEVQNNALEAINQMAISTSPVAS